MLWARNECPKSRRRPERSTFVRLRPAKNVATRATALMLRRMVTKVAARYTDSIREITIDSQGLPIL